MASIVQKILSLFGCKPEDKTPRVLAYPHGRKLIWDDGKLTDARELLNALEAHQGDENYMPTVQNAEDERDWMQLFPSKNQDDPENFALIYLPPECGLYDGYWSCDLTREETADTLARFEAGCDVSELWSQEDWYRV